MQVLVMTFPVEPLLTLKLNALGLKKVIFVPFVFPKIETKCVCGKPAPARQHPGSKKKSSSLLFV
jgi:hypothetical protein